MVSLLEFTKSHKLIIPLQEFMMQLTQHQSQVGNVLQEGNQLIMEGKLSAEADAQVHVQIGLLNNRWEELRVKAMDRQTK